MIEGNNNLNNAPAAPDYSNYAADQAAAQAHQDQLMAAAPSNLKPAIDYEKSLNDLEGPSGFRGPDDVPPTPPAAENALSLPAIEPVVVTQALGSQELVGEPLAGTPPQTLQH